MYWNITSELCVVFVSILKNFQNLVLIFPKLSVKFLIPYSTGLRQNNQSIRTNQSVNMIVELFANFDIKKESFKNLETLFN